MIRLKQKLKVVHDELTYLMVEAKLDSLSRSRIASASNRLLEISQMLDEVASEQGSHKQRSVIKNVMVFLAWWGELFRDIVTTRCEEDGS